VDNLLPRTDTYPEAVKPSLTPAAASFRDLGLTQITMPPSANLPEAKDPICAMIAVVGSHL
jgi:hypothetical protein